MMKTRKHVRGVTLLELMIVVMVVAQHMAQFVSQHGHQVDRMRNAECGMRNGRLRFGLRPSYFVLPAVAGRVVVNIDDRRVSQGVAEHGAGQAGALNLNARQVRHLVGGQAG